ncbi:SH3 domain-containing protein [Candidatus Peregrinibacteria bacterium]|nr:SH3 domain-containing protein [Candidatus Peregrinibacteria bacterium]MBI3816262.1 SH3 domain-containing protein [Candidatus Peregrinibacteria bacterium]
MNRYRPTRSKSRFTAFPLVFFVLILCFGILFTGCTSTMISIKGPDDVGAQQDITFTEQDVARFERLAKEGDAMVAQHSATGASSVAGSQGTLAQSTASLPVLDLSMVKTYDALRSAPAETNINLYRVTNDILKVRQQPSASSTLLDILTNGEGLTVNEFTNGEWARVTLPDGRRGYVAARYISKVTTDERLADDQKASKGLYYVSYQFVNVRQAPDQKSAKLGQIPGKAFVRPKSIAGPWATVEFQGKDGYVSLDYLTRFTPRFLVRQNAYPLPILVYHLSQPGMLDLLVQHVNRLRQAGAHILSLRDFASFVLNQEHRTDLRLDAKSVVIVVEDVTPDNIRKVTDTLYANNIRATVFLQTQHVSLAGITEKMLLTMQADGIDVESAAHTGDDLRSLTNAQGKLEVEQSRKILEDALKRPVVAIAYPQGGTNERVTQLTQKSGYLFALTEAPAGSFMRDQFLHLPGYAITSGMSAEDAVKLLR